MEQGTPQAIDFTFSFGTLCDDETVEGTETFSIRVWFEPRGTDDAQLAHRGRGISQGVLILDDDGGPHPVTPGPPTNVSLAANDTSLVLSWDEPANHRDFPGLSYEVEFRKDGGPWNSTGVEIDGTSASLTGARGSSYQARVLAKNGSASDSPRSRWVSAGPVTVPDAPTPGPPVNVSLAANDTSLVLSWDEPANHRDFPGLTYEVEFRQDGGPWL